MLVADDAVDADGLSACQWLDSAHGFALIRYFAEVDSTNTAALQDLSSPLLTDFPRLYLADRQTSGRGRHGRTWIADDGTLTFSLVVPVSSTKPIASKPTNPVPISIAVGVAVSRAIDHLAAPFTSRIKWPNDVYFGEGKVAGILIESSTIPVDTLVIGVGLNIATNLTERSEALDAPARSINELTQRYPHRYQWLPELVSQILEVIEESRVDPKSIVAEQQRRCMLTGTTIRYLREGQWQHAACEGIDSDGTLLIRDANGLRRLSSGEVQRIRSIR